MNFITNFKNASSFEIITQYLNKFNAINILSQEDEESEEESESESKSEGEEEEGGGGGGGRIRFEYQALFSPIIFFQDTRYRQIDVATYRPTN